MNTPCTGDDVVHRGPVVVIVERNEAAGLDGNPADAQRKALDHRARRRDLRAVDGPVPPRTGLRGVARPDATPALDWRPAAARQDIEDGAARYPALADHQRHGGDPVGIAPKLMRHSGSAPLQPRASPSVLRSGRHRRATGRQSHTTPRAGRSDRWNGQPACRTRQSVGSGPRPGWSRTGTGDVGRTVRDVV